MYNNDRRIYHLDDDYSTFFEQPRFFIDYLMKEAEKQEKMKDHCSCDECGECEEEEKVVDAKIALFFKQYIDCLKKESIVLDNLGDYLKERQKTRDLCEEIIEEFCDGEYRIN